MFNCCIKRNNLKLDRGYVWLIMMMSFLSHFVHVGFTSGVIGNLTVVHSKFFSIGLQQSSLIGSVHTATMFMFSPVASILVKKVGCRVTQIFGGICLILGLSLLSLATKQWHAICLFGILAGIGISATYVASSSILSMHFLKYKNLAFSFAPFGAIVGSAVWPKLSQHLFDTVGYSRAVAYFSIFHILHVIAGLSFCEPIQISHEAKLTEKKEVNVMKTLPEDSGYTEEHINKGFQKNEEILEQNFKDEKISDISPIEKKFNSDQQLSKKPSVSITASIFTLFKSSKTWLLLANFWLWNSCSDCFHILINDYLIKHTPLTVPEVTWALTVLGIAKLVGSLLAVSMSPLKFDRLNIHFLAVLLYSVTTIAIPYCMTKELCYTLMTFWGLGFSMSICNLLAVTMDFCEVETLPILFGFTLFAEGLGCLMGTPLCTLLAVKTEEQYGLVLGGCIGVIGSLILIPEMISRFRKKKTKTLN